MKANGLAIYKTTKQTGAMEFLAQGRQSLITQPEGTLKLKM
jgi:hypothetical protein